MKKTTIFMLFLFLLTSCAQKTPDTENPFKENKETELDTLIREDYIITKIAEHKDMLIIQYSSTVESKPSKLVIVDKEDYTLRKETENQTTFLDGFDIITKEAGFYINEGPIVTLYDYDLNVLKEIDIEILQNKQAMSLIWTDPFALSNDLKKITYVNHNTKQLVLYDFETQIEEVIYQLSDEEHHISSFDSLYLLEDYIGFAGAYTHEGFPEILNINVFGRIHIDSKEPELHFTSEVSAEGLDHYILLIDNIRADNEYTGTGFTTIYDIEKNTILEIELKESHNSFDVSILSHNMIVSYNDLSGEDSKYILYHENTIQEIDNILPKDITLLVLGDLYLPDKNTLIVYYTYASKDLEYDHYIKEIDINGNKN